MKVFISYPSGERSIAERVNLALLERGFDVFFDRDDLAAGKEYDRTIAESIAASDLFVFLITPASVSAGRYTLTELGFAQRKWPRPNGRVLPVLLRETPIDAIPSYLRAVSFLIPRGEPVAEIAAETQRLADSLPVMARLTRRIRTRNGAIGTAGVIAAVAILGFALAQRMGGMRATAPTAAAATRLDDDVGRRARAVAATADGGFVVVASEPSQVVRFSADGVRIGDPVPFTGEPVTLTQTPARIAVATAEPDGLTVFDWSDLHIDETIPFDAGRVRPPAPGEPGPLLSGDIQSVAIGGPRVATWWIVTGGRDGMPAVLRLAPFDKVWEVYTWAAQPAGIVGDPARGLRLRLIGRDLWAIAPNNGAPRVYRFDGAVRFDTLTTRSQRLVRCAHELVGSPGGNPLFLSCQDELQEVTVDGNELTIVAKRSTRARDRDEAVGRRTGEIIVPDSSAGTVVVALNHEPAAPNGAPAGARIVEVGPADTVRVLLDERDASVQSMAVTPRLIAAVLQRRDGSSDVVRVARPRRVDPDARQDRE